VTETPILIEPRPFQFFGKKWTEATAIGRACAATFAGYLIGEGIEFHHDPPGTARGPVHRFLIAASPTKVRRAAERALSPGKEALQPAAPDAEPA
jgi:hypothetical protein